MLRILSPSRPRGERRAPSIITTLTPLGVCDIISTRKLTVVRGELYMKKFKFAPQSLIYLIVTYVCALLFACFLEEFVRFSALFELKFFAERINVEDPLIWNITYEICFLLSYIIFHIIFYIAYKSRRKEFIDNTRGLISKKDGLIYHVKKYWLSDIWIIFIQVVAYLILFLLNRSFCPIAIIYRFCGVLFGVIVSIVFLIVMYINHVIFAQYRWRVNHYMHE